MAAPILAILVANITGSWRNAFLALAVPILLAGILVWTVARTQDSANLAAAAKEADGGPGWFQGLRTLGLLLAISMAAQLVFSGINSFLPLYLVDTRAASSDVAGLMVGVVYAAGLLGGPLGGTLSDRIGRKPVILMSVISMGPTMFLITISPMGPAMIAAIALYGLLVTLRFPTIESLIADEIPARRRATVMGGYYFLAQETSGIFTPAFGWLIDQSGMDNGFSLLTLVAVVCSLLVLWFWRKM